YQQVANTYLSTFQTLGSLGLLLGTVGLAVLLLRSLIERRAELALLAALGFRPLRRLSLLLAENSLLLILGLFTGTICALIAVLPFAMDTAAQDAKPAAAPAPEFGAKVLVVTVGDNGGGVFESAAIKTLGDRTFLVATAIDMGNQDWRAGARVWLAVADIRQI